MRSRDSNSSLFGKALGSPFAMPSITRRDAILALALSVLPLASSHAQTTGNWTYNSTVAANLSWNTSTSWTGLVGGVPNAIGSTPNFNFNITAARAITLDGDKTVGTLTIGDTGTSYFAYTLNAGSPVGRLLMDQTGTADTTINLPTAANNAANVINAGILLKDNLVINVAQTTLTVASLTVGGGITDETDSFSLKKTGVGLLTLNGANSYDGGTTLSAGRVTAGNVASFGTGAVTVEATGAGAVGAEAYLTSTAAAYPNNFTISGIGPTFTTGNFGAIRFNNGTSISGNVTVALDARISTFSGAIGTLNGNLSGTAALELNSSTASFNGTFNLNGDASGYSGEMTLAQGRLNLGPASNPGGSLTVKDGAVIAGETIVAGALTLGNSGSTTTGPTLQVDPTTSDALHTNGNLTLNGMTTVVLSGAVTGSSVKVLSYSGTLTGGASNLDLLGGLAAYRPGSGFDFSVANEISLTLVSGDVKWTGAASGNWNTTDLNWTDGTPTTFYNLDTVTFDDTAATNATFTTNLANATNNDLVFTALASGVAGEAVTIEYVNPGAADSPLGVTVTGNAITVSLATDSLSAITSTATAVKAEIEASGPASALVTVALAASNDGSGLVAALSATPLALANPTINLATGVTVSPGDMTFDHSAIDYTVSGSGAIAGGGSLTKSGSGMLTLSTANSFAGGASLGAGRLRVGSATALGTGLITITGGQLSSNGTGAFTLTNGLSMGGAFTLGDATNNGALTMSGASAMTSNATITVSSGLGIQQTIGGAITDGIDSFSLTKDGSAGVLRLNAANSYDGGTSVLAGRLDGGNVGAFGTGPVAVSDGASAFLFAAGSYVNNFTITGNGYTETAGILGAIRLQTSTIGGTITLAGDSRITAFGSTGTLAGNIGETGGARALELSNYSTTGDSTLTVSGNNTHSGGTTVKGAIVIAGNNNAFGTGDVTLQSNGTVARVTRVQLGANVELPAANGFVLDSNATSGTSAITSFAGDNATVSTAIVNGPVEILQSVGGGGHLASNKGSASVLRVMGAITSPNGVSVVVRQGVVELGGGGDYANMQIVDGTLKLAADAGLDPDATLTIGTSGTAGDAGIFDLNGFSQTLAGLGTGARPATVTNNGASLSTLTLNPALASAFAGTFTTGTSALNLAKTGAGTLTLSASSTSFTGSLSVTEGGLNLPTGVTLGATGAAASFGTGTTLSGEGTFGGDLTLSAATLDANGSTPARLGATGLLNTSGGVTVNLQGLPVTPGPVEIIGFGTLTGSAGDFTLANATSYRSPAFSVGASSVTLSLGAPVDLTWTGTGGSDWDIGTTGNWNDPSLNSSTFLVADNVTFGNSGGGTIGVPANVNATNLVINSNDDWLFQGAGTISSGAVTKDGTGSATFETPVDFAGTIALTSGTLRLSPPTGVTSALPGTITGAGTLAKGGDGILSVTGVNAGFTGSMVISKGELIPGNSTALGTAQITFGDATTSPTDVCTLTLGTGLALTNTPITVAATCISARITSTGSTITNTAITKKGPGKLTIGHATSLASTTNVITGASPITIEAGTLAGSSVTPISSSTTITMGNANTGTAATILELPANQTTANDVATLTCPLVLSPDAPNSEAIIRYPGGTSLGSLSFGGAISLNGRDLYLENTSNSNTPSRLYNITGTVSGIGNVRVRGGTTSTGEPGTTIRLTNTGNNFTGDVYVQTGRLQIGFSTTLGYIPDSSLVIMSAGTTLSQGNTSETIRGLLGGAATVEVPFTAKVDNGSGTASTRRLTVSDPTAANTHVYDGRIVDTSSTVLMALTKAGAATQVINGACSFTGTTLHTAGKLVINNSYASAITVSAGATLGGNMTSTAAITATAAGAKIAPGSSTGTMTAASAALNTGGVLETEIDDSSTPKTDKLVVSGNLNISGSTLNVMVAGVAAQPVYVIASYGTLTGTFGTLTGKPSNYDLVYNYNDGVSSNNIALVEVSDPYLGWLAAYPVITGANRAPDVDFDGDGLANGIEFVIGADPTEFTAPTTPGYPSAVVSSGNLLFTFKRVNASKVYPVTVETSVDLAAWPPADAYLVPTSDTAGPPVSVAGESVTATIPMGADPKKFARLQAAIPFTP